MLRAHITIQAQGRFLPAQTTEVTPSVTMRLKALSPLEGHYLKCPFMCPLRSISFGFVATELLHTGFFTSPSDLPLGIRESSHSSCSGHWKRAKQVT